MSHAALMEAIESAASGLLRSARLFDVYRPAAASADIRAGERSLAVRLELLDDEVTLTDERIDAEVSRLVESLGVRLGARLRA